MEHKVKVSNNGDRFKAVCERCGLLCFNASETMALDLKNSHEKSHPKRK